MTGMRVGELLTLAPDQVEQDEDGNYFVALEADKTKTKSSRIIPIPSDLAPRLIEMLSDRLPNYELLRQACHRASLSLKLRDMVTPHILRHTCATMLTAKGTPSLVVADLLGHKNLATTRRYAHTTMTALVNASEVMKSTR